MNRSTTNRRIAVVVAIGGLLVVAGTLGWLSPVRYLYDHSLGALGVGLTNLGSSTSQLFGNIGNVSKLARDNADLEAENAKLRQRLAADAETRSDNEILRRQLGLNVAGTPTQIGAEVIAFQPDSYRQFVTINKGSRDGVSVGQGAVSEGVLVGIVSEVQASTSKLALVTDPEFRLTAKNQDGNALGVVTGQLGNGLLMQKIGQTDTIKPGDTIVTAGLGGSVPAGLFIGTVQSVDAKDSAIFQSAQLSTPLKTNRLRFVFLVVGA